MASIHRRWEALPQRNRRARNKQQADIVMSSDSVAEENDIGSEEFSASDKLQAVVDGEGDMSEVSNAATSYERNIERVEQNIEDRKRLKRAEATLQGKDGCAREFYEYLDHTADVQFHVWGPTLVAAFENMAACIFNFITDIDSIEVNPSDAIEIEVTGHDMYSLLFNYMDEILFRFASDSFCCLKATIKEFDRDSDSYRIVALLSGESFNPSKHPQGTEIKAITYSNMQIYEKDDKCEFCRNFKKYECIFDQQHKSTAPNELDANYARISLDWSH